MVGQVRFFVFRAPATFDRPLADKQLLGVTMATSGDQPLTARLWCVCVLAVSLMLAALYYVTFLGSSTLATARDPVAFVDTSHYVELLEDHHYLECLREEPAHHGEHRRKAVHHLAYLLVADSAITAIGLISGISDDLSLIWLVSPLLGALKNGSSILWRHVRRETASSGLRPRCEALRERIRH